MNSPEKHNNDGSEGSAYPKMPAADVQLLKDQMDSKLRETIQEFINKTRLIPEIDIYVVSLNRDESNNNRWDS